MNTRHATGPRSATSTGGTIRALTLLVIVLGMLAAGCIEVVDHDPRDDALSIDHHPWVALTISSHDAA